MRINVADNPTLKMLLERKRRSFKIKMEPGLKETLMEILLCANRLVPSESGSILFDDPGLKLQKKNGELVFGASFGTGSEKLSGVRLSSSTGIVGMVYSTGKPYISRKARADSHFYGGIDKKTHITTKSIICAPIKINGHTIGVIELINRKEGAAFNRDDLVLLNIFAGYTSTLIQNALDARSFADLSMRDSLSGLYNDRYLHQRLRLDVSSALRNRTDLSLVFLDLDGFKSVNDTFGHLVGSEVLAAMGPIMTGVFNAPGASCVRYGGDEFTAILPGIDVGHAVKLAEKLRKTVEGHTFVAGAKGEKKVRVKGRITTSVGVASIKANLNGPKDAKKTCEELIRHADTAMYLSKRQGKNTVTIAPSGPCRI